MFQALLANIHVYAEVATAGFQSGTDALLVTQSDLTLMDGTLTIDLPRPRAQLTTREDPRFLSYRHRLFNLLPLGH